MGVATGCAANTLYLGSGKFCQLGGKKLYPRMLLLSPLPSPLPASGARGQFYAVVQIKLELLCRRTSSTNRIKISL